MTAPTTPDEPVTVERPCGCSTTTCPQHFQALPRAERDALRRRAAREGKEGNDVPD